MSIMMMYVTEIFASTNPNQSPLYASTMITTVVLIANFVFLTVVDRAGRRKFYISSSLASSFGLALFASYLHFLSDNHSFDWFPVVCISYVLFANRLGMTPITWLMIIEIMPQKVTVIFTSFTCFFI